MNDIIMKKKRGNFAIKSYSYRKGWGWLIKIDNSKLYIENFGKIYTIDLEKLVNISSCIIRKGFYNSNPCEAYFLDIKIEYLKKGKIKFIYLEWAKLKHKTFLTPKGYYDNKDKPEKYYADEREIQSLLGFFIRKSDETDKTKMMDTDYIPIRENDEIDYIEKIYKKELKLVIIIILSTPLWIFLFSQFLIHLFDL